MTDYLKYLEYQREYHRKMFLSAEKDTECICPGCGFGHTLKLYWTGTGKPRKFCPDCVQGVDAFEADEMRGAGV